MPRPPAARAVLAPLLADHAGGWKVPEHAPVAVDRQYVLAAAGLLAAEARSPGDARHVAGVCLTPALPVAPDLRRRSSHGGRRRLMIARAVGDLPTLQVSRGR